MDASFNSKQIKNWRTRNRQSTDYVCLFFIQKERGFWAPDCGNKHWNKTIKTVENIGAYSNELINYAEKLSIVMRQKHKV